MTNVLVDYLHKNSKTGFDSVFDPVNNYANTTDRIAQQTLEVVDIFTITIQNEVISKFTKAYKPLLKDINKKGASILESLPIEKMDVVIPVQNILLGIWTVGYGMGKKDGNLKPANIATFARPNNPGQTQLESLMSRFSIINKILSENEQRLETIYRTTPETFRSTSSRVNQSNLSEIQNFIRTKFPNQYRLALEDARSREGDVAQRLANNLVNLYYTDTDIQNFKSSREAQIEELTNKIRLSKTEQKRIQAEVKAIQDGTQTEKPTGSKKQQTTRTSTKTPQTDQSYEKRLSKRTTRKTRKDERERVAQSKSVQEQITEQLKADPTIRTALNSKTFGRTYLSKRTLTASKDYLNQTKNTIKESIASYLSSNNSIDENALLRQISVAISAQSEITQEAKDLQARINKLQKAKISGRRPNDQLLESVGLKRNSSYETLDDYIQDLAKQKNKLALSSELPNTLKSTEALRKKYAEGTKRLSEIESRLSTLQGNEQEYAQLIKQRKQLLATLKQGKTSVKSQLEAADTKTSRAEMVAATELGFAYNLGRLEAMNDNGVERFIWVANTELARGRVCSYCLQRHRNPRFIRTLQEILLEESSGKGFKEPDAALIPAHPLCMCYWEPYSYRDSPDAQSAEIVPDEPTPPSGVVPMITDQVGRLRKNRFAVTQATSISVQLGYQMFAQYLREKQAEEAARKKAQREKTLAMTLLGVGAVGIGSLYAYLNSKRGKTFVRDFSDKLKTIFRDTPERLLEFLKEKSINVFNKDDIAVLKNLGVLPQATSLSDMALDVSTETLRSVYGTDTAKQIESYILNKLVENIPNQIANRYLQADRALPTVDNLVRGLGVTRSEAQKLIDDLSIVKQRGAELGLNPLNLPSSADLEQRALELLDANALPLQERSRVELGRTITPASATPARPLSPQVLRASAAVKTSLEEQLPLARSERDLRLARRLTPEQIRSPNTSLSSSAQGLAVNADEIQTRINNLDFIYENSANPLAETPYFIEKINTKTGKRSIVLNPEVANNIKSLSDQISENRDLVEDTLLRVRDQYRTGDESTKLLLSETIQQLEDLQEQLIAANKRLNSRRLPRSITSKALDPNTKNNIATSARQRTAIASLKTDFDEARSLYFKQITRRLSYLDSADNLYINPDPATRSLAQLQTDRRFVEARLNTVRALSNKTRSEELRVAQNRVYRFIDRLAEQSDINVDTEKRILEGYKEVFEQRQIETITKLQEDLARLDAAIAQK